MLVIGAEDDRDRPASFIHQLPEKAADQGETADELGVGVAAREQPRS